MNCTACAPREPYVQPRFAPAGEPLWPERHPTAV